MERIQKYLAAFMLAVFVSWTVAAPQSKADFLGIVDFIDSAKETVQLVELIATVGSISAQVSSITDGVKSVLRFVQTGVYSVRSLRIIESYTRTVSQFVSNLATGRFYNYRSAVLSGQNAARALNLLVDIVKDLDSFLSNGKSAEGSSTVVQSVFDRVSKAYADFMSDITKLNYENRRAASQQLRDAEMMAMVNGFREDRVNRYLNQYEAMTDGMYDWTSLTDLVNISVLNPNM